MVEYIYFVKCPNCEDEPFGFFDEAKDFALSCLSKKPIITQVEVCRNDFGECTDSCDLGTVWSWEKMMNDIPDKELTRSVFNKDDLKYTANGEDPEFDALDNSLDSLAACAFDCFDDTDLEEGIFDSKEKKQKNYAELIKTIFGTDYNIVVSNTVSDASDLLQEVSDTIGEDDRGKNLAKSILNTIKNAKATVNKTPHSLVKAIISLGQKYEYDSLNLADLKTFISKVGKLQTASKDGHKAMTFLFEKVNKALSVKIDSTIKFLSKEFGLITEDFDDEERLSSNAKGDYLVRASSGHGYTVYNRSDVAIGGFDGDDDTEAIRRFKSGRINESKKHKKKAIPTGWTVKDLVEEMEKNEDTVECTCCNELFDKSECHKEVDLGYLCSRCEAAVKSRGETLTFEEGLLTESSKYGNGVEFHYDALTANIITGVIPATLEDPAEYLEGEYTDEFDFEVEINIVEEVLRNFLTEEDVSDVPGGLEALKDDATWRAFLDVHFEELLEKYNDKFLEYFREDAEEAAEEEFQKRREETLLDLLEEDFDGEEYVTFNYDNLTITVQSPMYDVDDWDEAEHSGDYSYKVTKDDVATAIWENFLTEDDIIDVEGGFETLEDTNAWNKFLETHFDDLLDKYHSKLLDYFKKDAIEEFESSYTWSDYKQSLEDFWADV